MHDAAKKTQPSGSVHRMLHDDKNDNLEVGLERLTEVGHITERWVCSHRSWDTYDVYLKVACIQD